MHSPNVIANNPPIDLTKSSFIGTKRNSAASHHPDNNSSNRMSDFYFLVPNLYFFSVFWCISTMYHLAHPTMENTVLTCFARVFIGFTYTNLLASIYWKIKIFELSKSKRILNFICITGIIFVPANITYILSDMYLEPIWFRNNGNAMIKIITVRGFLLLVWHVYYTAVWSMKTAKELEIEILKREAALLENQVRFLQTQLNPHFLLNSLNTLIANSANKKSVETIASSLSSYLKYTLQENAITTELGKEIDALEKFISLQSARMDSHIQYSISCNPQLRFLKIPSRMLQPLIENAIKHGTPDPDSGTLEIHITIKEDNGAFYFITKNSGQWIDSSMSGQPGLGIDTLLKQLKILIGPEARLDFSTRENHVVASISIPENKLLSLNNAD